jgi:hypothetical protein
MNKQAKDQLVKCIIDLAARFDELGDKQTQAILLVVAGTVKEGSQDILAIWMGEYAKLRVEMLKHELGEDSP